MRKRKAFTLIELLVVIAIIALLVSILLPSLNQAKELARNLVCKTNLKGLGAGCAMYYSEYGGIWPMAWNPPPGYSGGYISGYSWSYGLWEYCGASEWSRNYSLTYCPNTYGYYTSERFDPPINGPSYYITAQNRTAGSQRFPKGGWLIYGDRNGIYNIDRGSYVEAVAYTASYMPRIVDEMLPSSAVLYEPIMNTNGVPLSQPTMIPTYVTNMGDWDRHSGTMNMLFAGGHVDISDIGTEWSADWESQN